MEGTHSLPRDVQARILSVIIVRKAMTDRTFPQDHQMRLISKCHCGGPNNTLTVTNHWAGCARLLSPTQSQIHGVESQGKSEDLPYSTTLWVAPSEDVSSRSSQSLPDIQRQQQKQEHRLLPSSGLSSNSGHQRVPKGSSVSGQHVARSSQLVALNGGTSLDLACIRILHNNIWKISSIHYLPSFSKLSYKFHIYLFHSYHKTDLSKYEKL